MWYIKIYDFMITQLHLKGNELLVYAWLYGWHESGNTIMLRGYQIATLLNIDPSVFTRTLKKLRASGLIDEKSIPVIDKKSISESQKECEKIDKKSIKKLTKSQFEIDKKSISHIYNNIYTRDNITPLGGQIADATDGQKKSLKKPIEGDAKKEKEKLRKKKSPSIVTECRRHWEEHYKQSKGVEYYYTAKDAAAVKQILDKIRFCMPEAERDHEDIVLANFKAFANAIFYGGRIDGWLRDNLSLSIINSKFNEIHNLLRNGKSRKDTNNGSNADDRRVSKDFLAELMRAAGGKV